MNKKEIIEKNDKALPQSEPSAQQIKDNVLQSWVGDTERNCALIPEEIDDRMKLDKIFMEKIEETIKLCNEAQQQRIDELIDLYERAINIDKKRLIQRLKSLKEAKG